MSDRFGFLGAMGGRRPSAEQAQKLEALSNTAEGQKLRALLGDEEKLKTAIETGDTAALKTAMETLLRSEEGRRLFQQLGSMMGKQ